MAANQQAITLPGYRSIVGNAVYARPGNARVTIAGKRVNVRQMLLLNRCKCPEKEDVIRYLEGCAEDADLSANMQDTHIKKTVRNAIRGLPEYFRECIRSHQHSREFIGQYIEQETGSKKSQRKYVELRYGLMALKTIESNLKHGAELDAAWYYDAFGDRQLREAGLGEKWAANLLLDRGGLPEKEDMNVLLRHGTWGSGTLMLRGDYHFEEVGKTLDAVYEGLSEPSKIRMLPDISEYYIGKRCLLAINDLHKQAEILIKEGVQELAQDILERINSLPEEPHEDDKEKLWMN